MQIRLQYGSHTHTSLAPTQATPRQWQVLDAYLLCALQVRFCQLLVSETSDPSTAQLPPSRVREALLQAIAMYPFNSQLLGLLVEVEHRAHALIRLRQFLHTALAASPSPQLLAAAAACEAARPGGRARLRAIFEGAVAVKKLAASPLAWLMYMR